MSVLGVGFLGGGPVTQAIHLPVLDAMRDRFRVVSVMDVDATIAAAVAGRCGAAPATSAEAVIADPAVDVIAICSPNAFHADQAIAACAAGKKAVLCEKPLAISVAEVERIRVAAQASGTRILVGTMHAFDPAYRQVQRLWREHGDKARLVQSSIYLPSNDTFIDQATQQAVPPPARRGSGAGGAEHEAMMFEAAMLGLAIHNVPLVRDYFPSAGTLCLARFVPPFGYALALSDGAAIARMEALMPGQWPPKWTFRVVGERCEIRVAFPPSYVLAGSAQAEFRSGDTVQAFSYDDNGYAAQWRNLHDMVVGDAAPIASLQTAAEDMLFSLDLARLGCASIRSAA